LRPCSRTSFHHQPEAQHPKSSAIHKLPADYPIFGGEPEVSGRAALAASVENDPKWTLTSWRLRKGHHPLPERELSRYDHLS